MIILVKDVSIIKIDGANANTVSTNKIRTVEERVPESESKFNETPPSPVTTSLAFGAFCVAPYWDACTVLVAAKKTQSVTAMVANTMLKIQYVFFFLLIILLPISSVIVL